MPTTDRLALPYPDEDDAADPPHDFQALSEKLDTIVTGYDQGAIGSRPAPGTQGLIYFATDTGQASLDNGSAWVTLPTSGDTRFTSIGDLKCSARRAEHDGWILADGRALPPGSYPSLREVLIGDGSAFGVSGSNPRIPDLRGRVPAGVGNNPGGGVAGNYVLGAKLGAEAVAIGITEMPSHNHGGATGNDTPDHTHGQSRSFADWHINAQGGSLQAVGGIGHYSPYATSGASARHAHSISSQGSGLGHENRPPMTVVNWFVFAG